MKNAYESEGLELLQEQIFKMLIEGKTYDEMAERLGISTHTVKSFAAMIQRKIKNN